VLNDLRGRIAVQTDGGCAPAATLSSARCSAPTKFGFATAPLIARAAS
jgi:hypothetical protein